MHPRGIDKDNLAALIRKDALDLVAGGLGDIGDDADFFSQDGIQEGGFSGIRPTDDGDHTTMQFLILIHRIQEVVLPVQQ